MSSGSNPVWRFFLPAFSVALLLSVVPAHTEEPVVVPVRVIYPGETISANALKAMVLRRQQRHMPAIARVPEDLEGKVARRTLLPGRLVPLSSVRESYLVEPGTAVTATYTDGALTISTLAVPLQAAGAGDPVKLRNMDSGTVFTGIVMQDGTVRVGGQ